MEQVDANQIVMALLMIAIVVFLVIGQVVFRYYEVVVSICESINHWLARFRVMSDADEAEDEEDTVPPHQEDQDEADGRTDEGQDEADGDRKAALIALLMALREAGRSRDMARGLLRPFDVTFSNALWSEAAPQAPQERSQAVAPWSGRVVDPTLFPADPPPPVGVPPQATASPATPQPQATAGAPQELGPLPAALRYVGPQEFAAGLQTREGRVVEGQV